MYPSNCLARVAIVCTAIVLCGGCSSRSSPQPPTASGASAISPASSASNGDVSRPSREQAIALLTNTDTFASTAVGEGGQPSDESIAFARVFLEPDADAVFKQLLGEAKVAGQLYALCELYFTDPDTFRQEVAQYQADKSEDYEAVCESSVVFQIMEFFSLSVLQGHSQAARRLRSSSAWQEAVAANREGRAGGPGDGGECPWSLAGMLSEIWHGCTPCSHRSLHLRTFRSAPVIGSPASDFHRLFKLLGSVP